MEVVAKYPMKEQELIKNNNTFSGLNLDKEIEKSILGEMEGQKAKESFKVDDKGTTNNSSLKAEKVDPLGLHFSEKKPIAGKKNMNKEEKEKLMEKKKQYWDILRKMYTKGLRDSDHMDSVDWEAVRCAPADEFAKVILVRGQHKIIGERIQV